MDDADAARLDALARRAAAGDREAFHALAVAVEPMVRITIAACSPHPHLIEEMVQAALVQAFLRLSTYHGGGTFVAWIRAVARNELRKELRARQREGPLARDLDAVMVDAQLEALEDAEAAERRQAALGVLRACLERLPAQLRGLVEAHHYQDQPIAELARQMKRSANWVAVTLFRLRRRLADCVREGGHGL